MTAHKKERFCGVCEGEILFIGNLGSLAHGQCRQCGLGFNWPRPKTKRQREEARWKSKHSRKR